MLALSDLLAAEKLSRTASLIVYMIPSEMDCSIWVVANLAFQTKQPKDIAEMRALCTCIILVLLCVSPARVAAESKRLSLTGSSTIAPLASEIAQRFEKTHGGIRIDVQTGGSSRGIADAKRGLADIGMSSRPLYEAEKAGVSVYPVAMDGVTFVVHAANTVENLTKEQALHIFSGKISNWKELGGADAAITVIDRAKGRSEVSLLSEYFGVSSRTFKADVIAGENQQCVKLLSSNKNAITYLSIGTAEFEAARGTAIKLLSLQGVEASSETVRAGTFPIVRPLVLVSAAQPSQETQEFITYARSTEVHDLIKGQAFVPLQ